MKYHILINKKHQYFTTNFLFSEKRNVKINAEGGIKMKNNISGFEIESNVASYCNAWPRVFDYAHGSIIKDVDGNEYIDFFCGASALNYGHNPDYIEEKLIEYLRSKRIIHALDMYTKLKQDYLAFFKKEILAPRKLDFRVQFTGPTGTNAVEAALKLARKVKGRSNIMAISGAFHGMTLGSLALTTDSFSRDGAGVNLENVTHVPAPYTKLENGENFDTLKHIEWLLTYDHSGMNTKKIPAAIIIETLQSEGGVHDLGKEFLVGLRKLCDKYDILLIIDDIQIACYRTGTFFSFEEAGIVPDIVVLSKSLSGYGLPFSLTLFKKELDQWKPAEHNGTFRGFGLAMVGSKAGIELAKKLKIEDQVKTKAKIISDYLNKTVKKEFPEIEIRGKGMLWGIELHQDHISKKVVNICIDNGLILERCGGNNSVVKLMPALNIPEDLLIKGLDIVYHAVVEAMNK